MDGVLVLVGRGSKRNNVRLVGQSSMYADDQGIGSL